MIGQIPDFRTTEAVNDEKRQLEVQEGKGRILVADRTHKECSLKEFWLSFGL